LIWSYIGENINKNKNFKKYCIITFLPLIYFVWWFNYLMQFVQFNWNWPKSKCNLYLDKVPVFCLYFLSGQSVTASIFQRFWPADTLWEKFSASFSIPNFFQQSKALSRIFIIEKNDFCLKKLNGVIVYFWSNVDWKSVVLLKKVRKKSSDKYFI
jgi:hypothetical protein